MRFIHFSRYLVRTICSSLIIIYLASCSSSNSIKVKSTKKTNDIKQTTDIKKVSAKHLIRQAENSEADAANLLLLQASQQYLNENNPYNALWLAHQLLTIKQTPEITYQLNLIISKSYLNLLEFQKADEFADKLQVISTEQNVPHTRDFFILQHQLAIDKQQPVLALNAYLQAFALTTEQTQEDIFYIWQTISQFSLWQQNQLKNLQAPYVNGWVSFVQLSNKFGDKPTFLTQLHVWQKNHPTHPANMLEKSLFQYDLTPEEQKTNIAVILPLTGKQAKAGNSAQQGILASYNQQSDITLHFFDSQTLNTENLATTFLEKNIDFVIGPLLKENVKKYLANETLTIPTLLLNVPLNSTLKAHQFAISMRPEDEAIQAAALLSQKQFKQPIVMSHKDNVSLRIANAFAKKWQSLTGERPTIVEFEQGKEMQTVLKKTLSVDQSQSRINILKSRIRERLKTEFRNRRDIDMIYIVGNPRQTRLLKPYIDVNISPFAELIPIFASSKSHSMNIDKNTINDLRGLTFSQMPWLLKSTQQNKELAETSKILWPKRTDGLQRIFAMGYDSFKLIEKLPKMKAQNYLRHYGQTGVLKLGHDNILTRTLLWGHYTRNRVTEIVME